MVADISVERIKYYCGMTSNLEAHLAHNQEYVGSCPTSAIFLYLQAADFGSLNKRSDTYKVVPIV